MVGGMHGREGMCGRGCAWQGGHAWQGACIAGGGLGVRGRYYEIRSMSGRYASYWNAYLFHIPNSKVIVLMILFNSDLCGSNARLAVTGCGHSIRLYSRMNLGLCDVIHGMFF